MNMEVFSTKGLSLKSSKEYWNDAICETFTELDTDFTNGDVFHGELSSVQLGELSFSKVNVSQSNVHHTNRHVSKTKESVYLLHLQLENQSLNSQFGNEVTLKKGDFTIVDSTTAYSVKFDNEISMGVLKIPHGSLAQRIAIPNQVLGMKFSGNRGISGMLSQMLQSYWWQENYQTTEAINVQLAENILDLLSTSIQSKTRQYTHQAPLKNTRCLQIKKYTSYNLMDPNLSPRKIAAAFNITPRYLHQIFASCGNESIGQFVLRRRLEECARQLADPAMLEVTLTDIAFGWGFNSMTHFSRVFKEKYQSSPRQFRQLISQKKMLKSIKYLSEISF